MLFCQVLLLLFVKTLFFLAVPVTCGSTQVLNDILLSKKLTTCSYERLSYHCIRSTFLVGTNYNSLLKWQFEIPSSYKRNLIIFFCGWRSLRENMIISPLLCVISKFCKLRHIYGVHRVSRCSF